VRTLAIERHNAKPGTGSHSTGLRPCIQAKTPVAMLLLLAKRGIFMPMSGTARGLSVV
jgi:hypothetical protein